MVKLHEQAGKPSSDRTQEVLANGDLLKMLFEAGPRLSGVDRSAFKALLAPAPQPIAWGTAADYAAKLRDWNGRFRLWLSDRQIDELFAKLPDHAGPLQPTGITLTLGKGLQYDWKVVMQVLKYEVEKLGVRFTEYFKAKNLKYYPGSELKAKRPELDVALLDLQTFWDSQNGVVPREARSTRSRWPGLEVAWLLALNPRWYLAMDGETVPFVWATGLVVYSECVPVFGRDADEAFVFGDWGDYSVVAFREC